MKNISKILVLLVITISCKAQSPIINIEDDKGERIKGSYSRDTNNLLNQFVGTYIYTNGTTSLKIVLQKKIMCYDGYKYDDALVGEYKYIENGVEKINTLSNFLENHLSMYDYGIKGNGILRMGNHMCFGCTENEIRVRCSLRDDITDNSALFVISKVNTNGQPALKLDNVWWQIRSRNLNLSQPAFLPPSFPGGEYILIKQP